jgi:type II secretory pathway pseudopilin PulG
MKNLSVRKFSSLHAFTAKQRERASAFTLLELLVVITIIIVLVSMLFPAFRGIQDQAKRTQAKNDLNQIVTAISAFYTEYGRYPVAPATTSDQTATYGAGTDNSVVFNVLRNDVNHGDKDNVKALNPRQIVFIEPPMAKDQVQPKLGIKFLTGIWFDPWGYQYKVTIDANYNAVTNAPANYVDLKTTYATVDPDTGVRTGAISWTLGADNTYGDNNNGYYKDPDSGIQSDDVVSWQ